MNLEGVQTSLFFCTEKIIDFSLQTSGPWFFFKVLFVIICVSNFFCEVSASVRHGLKWGSFISRMLGQVVYACGVMESLFDSSSNVNDCLNFLSTALHSAFFSRAIDVWISSVPSYHSYNFPINMIRLQLESASRPVVQWCERNRTYLQELVLLFLVWEYVLVIITI